MDQLYLFTPQAPHKPSLVGLKPTKEGEERKYADYTGDDHMFDGF
jgi:hypothetical protein